MIKRRHKSCSACLYILRRFFLGVAYPPLVCITVLLGHVLSLELLAVAAVLLSASAAMLVTDSLIPLITPAVTLTFVMSRAHSPGIPSFSGYMSDGARPVIFALLFTVLAPVVIRTVMYRLRAGARIKILPLLALLTLAVGFALGGAGSPEWSARSLIFGLLEGAAYILPFTVFSVGLDGESFEDMASYFAYVSALSVLLLSAEVLWLYIGPDTPISGGNVIKSMIVFGWGTWTSMGAALAVLIPACFVGTLYSEKRYLYLASASLALGAIYATHSRGALLACALAYLISLAAAAIITKDRLFIALFALILGFGAGFIFGAGERLPEMLRVYLSDNGRFRLWELAVEKFRTSPIFGVGFFGLEYPPGDGYFTGADFLPPLMHGTPFQLIAATGLVGAVAYSVYRASTLVPLLRDPSVARLTVFLSSAVMLLLSLVENYVFQFYPVLHYTVAIEICRLKKAN